MQTIIKDSFRYFVLTFIAFVAALLVVSVVRAATWTAPTASFPNGNISWPTNCNGAGQVIQTDANGNLVCGSAVATYQ